MGHQRHKYQMDTRFLGPFLTRLADARQEEAALSEEP